MGAYRTEGFQNKRTRSVFKALDNKTGAEGKKDTTTTILTVNCRKGYGGGKEKDLLRVVERERKKDVGGSIGNESRSDGNAMAVCISSESGAKDARGIEKYVNSDLDTEPSGSEDSK
jgi:hypothetical protein